MKGTDTPIQETGRGLQRKPQSCPGGNSGVRAHAHVSLSATNLAPATPCPCTHSKTTMSLPTPDTAKSGHRFLREPRALPEPPPGLLRTTTGLPSRCKAAFQAAAECRRANVVSRVGPLAPGPLAVGPV